MVIPPSGYGAVEILIWHYKVYLERIGHTVTLINENIDDVLSVIGDRVFDVVHICWPTYFKLFEHINCHVKLCNIHCGDLYTMNECEFDVESWKKWGCYVECLSPYVKEFFLKHGYPEDKLLLTKNGIPKDTIAFREKPLFPKAICLATLDNRKRQYLIENMPRVDCVGPVYIHRSDKINTQAWNYLGEWKKKDVQDYLTTYSSMVLLSESEADPLSVKEGLMAGLGLILSENASQNLDINKPFIDVIPESKISDRNYVQQTILFNIRKSVPLRTEIRQYAIENFEFQGVIDRYIENLWKTGMC